MSKVGRIIPKPIKNGILWVARRPEKIKLKVYRAASQGKIPFPDKAYIKWNFKVHNNGAKLDLNNPKTLQEKLSWMKLNYHNPQHTQMVDKYGVREIIKNKLGEEYLVPLIGVYNSFGEIDFDALPNQFVLKCTHDSGSVVICKDKHSFDYNAAKKKLEMCLGRNQFYLSREWPYKNVTPRIICEPYLKDERETDRPDYKFLCFHGEPKMMLVLSDRGSEDTQKMNYYTLDWELLPITEKVYPNNPIPDRKPEHFDKMVEFAKILSKDIPFVRVDFTCVNGKLYFGELTFYHNGAQRLLYPLEYNRILGDWLNLPPKMTEDSFKNR